MFERFTDRARRTLTIAQSEASDLQHGLIGTGHLLLGLTVEEEGIAGRVLADHNLTPGIIRSAVEAAYGGVDKSTVATPSFTPRAKKVLELCLREALQLGHSYIGTEHMLLALIREGSGHAAEILVQEHVDLTQLRQAVIAKLSGSDDPRPAGDEQDVAAYLDELRERARRFGILRNARLEHAIDITRLLEKTLESLLGCVRVHVANAVDDEWEQNIRLRIAEGKDLCLHVHTMHRSDDGRHVWVTCSGPDHSEVLDRIDLGEPTSRDRSDDIRAFFQRAMADHNRAVAGQIILKLLDR